MTTATTLRPTTTITVPAAPLSTTDLTLGAAVTAASDAVSQVPLDDPSWDTLGPRLTAFVDAARRAAGQPGSPIRPDEVVAPALRVRDLGRLAQRTIAAAASARFVPTDVEAHLRFLQAAALR